MDAVPETQAMQDVLDPRFSIHSPLRCYGPGSLDRGEDTQTKSRIAIRWLPVDAGGESASNKVSQLPVKDALPRIHAKGKVGSLAYFAMDFPEGKLLAAMLGTPIELEKILRIGIDIADALATCHDQGMVHGELSPHSILFASTGKAMLWDVPLVVADRLTERRGDERSLAKLGRIVSSMAPECARGLLAVPASDVYSLAALLCRAAGDGVPQGATTLAKVHEIGSGRWQPEPPRALPMALRVVLSLACNSEPSARPAAAVLAAQLRDIASDQKKGPAAPKAEAKNGSSGVVTIKNGSSSAPAADANTSPALTPAKNGFGSLPVLMPAVEAKTSPALPPAPPAFEDDPITSPQQVPTVIPYETNLEAKAEEDEAEMISSGSAEMISSGTAEIISGTSEIISGATDITQAALSVMPPAPPHDETSFESLNEDVKLNLSAAPLPSMSQPIVLKVYGSEEEKPVSEEAASPPAFELPDQSVSQELIIPTSGLEPVSGPLFGAAGEAPKSKWKSPFTWLGVGVAVIIPVALLAVFLSSRSHSKQLPPPPPAAVAAPAPVESKPVDAAPEEKPAPAEIKATKFANAKVPAKKAPAPVAKRPSKAADADAPAAAAPAKASGPSKNLAEAAFDGSGDAAAKTAAPRKPMSAKPADAASN